MKARRVIMVAQLGFRPAAVKRFNELLYEPIQKGGKMNDLGTPGEVRADITLIPYNQKAMDSIETAVKAFVAGHDVIVIMDDDQLKAARALWEECKAQVKQIDLDAAPIRDPLYTALENLYARIRGAKQPVLDLIAKIVPAIKTYADDQERKSKAAARELEDKRLTEATALEGEGKHEEAGEVLARAAGTRNPAPPAGPKLDQRTFGKKWYARVFNPSAFYASIGNGQTAAAYAPVDLPKLCRLARDVKQKDLGIPGVEGYEG